MKVRDKVSSSRPKPLRVVTRDGHSTKSRALERLGAHLGLVVVAGASVSGCHPGIIESNWTLEDAREFHEFSLFWLGESHEGLPLTVTYRSETVAQNIVRFVYGEPIRTQSASTAPLHILIQPYCDSTPERTQTRLARYSDVGGSFRDVEVRGLRGILTGDESDGSVYVWTGDSALQISGVAPLPATEALIPIAEDSSAPLKPLQPPTSTEC